MGGHGGLNILPQKSWHVYNRENRSRVERDQGRVRETEQRGRERQRRANCEYSTDVLRRLKRKRETPQRESSDDTGECNTFENLRNTLSKVQNNDSSDDDAYDDQNSQKLNSQPFFLDEHSVKETAGSNMLNAAEKAKNRIDKLQKLNARWNLGGGNTKEVPWWMKPSLPDKIEKSRDMNQKSSSSFEYSLSNQSNQTTNQISESNSISKIKKHHKHKHDNDSKHKDKEKEKRKYNEDSKQSNSISKIKKHHKHKHDNDSKHKDKEKEKRKYNEDSKHKDKEKEKRKYNEDSKHSKHKKSKINTDTLDKKYHKTKKDHKEKNEVQKIFPRRKYNEGYLPFITNN